MADTALATRASSTRTALRSSHLSAHPSDPHPLDLDRCIHLAADTRPWHQRAEWHERAACRGLGPSTFVGDQPPGQAVLAVCTHCPVREECLVDGLRQRADGLLAEAPTELFGHFGGLSPAVRWSVLTEIRRRALALGVTLADFCHNLPVLVLRLHNQGWACDRIAEETGAAVGHVVDVLIWELHQAGYGHRTIAEHLPGRSYKWVERRLRVLRELQASGFPACWPQ